MKTAIAVNHKAIVSSRGQVVIPAAIRKKSGIHIGNELLFVVRADSVIEIKQMKRSIKMFFGRCKKKHESPMSIKDMDKAIMQAVSEEENPKQN